MISKNFVIFSLFFLIMMPVGAETDTYELEYNIIKSATKDGGNYGTYGIGGIKIGDVDTLRGITFLQCYFPMSTWCGGTDVSNYTKVSLYSDSGKTNHIGSGIFGYIRLGDSSGYNVQLFIDDIDWGGLSGNQMIYWAVKAGQPAVGSMNHHYTGYTDYVHGKALWVLSADPNYGIAGGTVHTVSYEFNFYNDIEYFYNETNARCELTIYRNSTYPSKWYVYDGNTLFKNETDLQTNNETVYSYDLDNLTWDTYVITDSDNKIELEINWSALMDDGLGLTGEITLSQTTYVKPDSVLVYIDLENADYVDYRYYAVIQNYNGTAWVDLTNWLKISSDWESSKVWEYTWTDENLPITIRGVLYEYDLNTETYDMVSYSESSTYVEPPPGTTGSISTDKTLYDVGDTVIVNYTTADSGYVIAQKWPTAMWDMGEYHIWEVISGSGTRTFVIPPSGSGEWRVKLSVNNQDVDTVFFTVNETTSPFLAWHDIDGVLGEIQALRFYSDDAAATLKIYDADLTIIYDETVGDGYFDNYAIGTQTNQPPGNWIASLNCSGSYYNDTLTMYAKDAYVSFDADSYTLGQTITVNYYMKRSTQTIVLYDANKKDMITWTTTGDYIHLGSGSVDFTLSDDNEYGLNIVADVDANNIKLGLWKVEVLDRGQPIADNPVYDSAKVSTSIESPADVSNEMISIFFSPEGIFLLFTAALTMMGLVTAQHPAGGGAGAVVGVGFGVYFNVLPVWMLLLMVIALVVLAGISIAVHFKGK